MIRFEATKDQLLQLAANAVNASAPMGAGLIHYKEKTYKPHEFNHRLFNNQLAIDYFEGRMTKLYIVKDETSWIMKREPEGDYQSWQHTYPTNRDLLNSVAGINILEGVDA